MSFARSLNEYWILVLNDNSTDNRRDRRNVQKVLFNKLFRGALQQAKVPCQVEAFRNASNIEVPVQHVAAGIEACLPFANQHAVRSDKGGIKGVYPGFRDEADIERWLMEHLSDTDAGRNLCILGRQVRVDRGIIDILCQNKTTGGLVVLEVRQGRAQFVDVGQLERYLSSARIKAMTGSKPITGYLIAETVESTVVRAIEGSPWPIAAFEIRWVGPGNVQLDYVTGHWE